MSLPPPDFSDRSADNPYLAGQHAGGPQWGGPPEPPYPTFCTVYFIIDLVFCFLRAITVLFAIIMIQNPEAANNPMVSQTSMFEIAAGLGMVLLGIPADFLMLFRNRAGAYLAGGKILFTLASFGVGIWQMLFILEQFPEGSPQRVGAIAGASFTMLIRLGLLAAYIGAIVTFLKWLSRKEAAAKPGS